MTHEQDATPEQDVTHEADAAHETGPQPLDSKSRDRGDTRVGALEDAQQATLQSSVADVYHEPRNTPCARGYSGKEKRPRAQANERGRKKKEEEEGGTEAEEEERREEEE